MVVRVRLRDRDTELRWLSGRGRRETAVNMWGSSVGEHLVAQTNE